MTNRHRVVVTQRDAQHLITQKPDAVIIIGFEDRVEESLPALEALTKALKSSAMQIHDRLVVRDGRWRSLDCHNPSCCPTEGSPVPEPADVSGVISEFVGRGVSPHTNRESLAMQVEPGPQAAAVGTLIRSVGEVADGAAAPHGEVFAAWPRILDPDGPAITVEDAVLAAMSLLDIQLRDGMVAWLCPGTIGLEEFSQDIQKLFSGLGRGRDMEDIDPASTGAQNAIQARLIGLCAMLPDDLGTPALSVLASYVWWRGDGALARVALARALRCDPDYRLALLLEQMVDLAIRPGQ